MFFYTRSGIPDDSKYQWQPNSWATCTVCVMFANLPSHDRIFLASACILFNVDVSKIYVRNLKFVYQSVMRIADKSDSKLCSGFFAVMNSRRRFLISALRSLLIKYVVVTSALNALVLTVVGKAILILGLLILKHFSIWRKTNFERVKRLQLLPFVSIYSVCARKSIINVCLYCCLFTDF